MNLAALIAAVAVVLGGVAEKAWFQATPPKLTWSMQIHDGSLIVEYRISNLSDQSIYVGTALWNPHSKTADPNLIAVKYSDGHELLFSKVTDQLGICTAYNCRRPPYHTRVAPHSSITGRTVIPLPLRAASACSNYETQTEPLAGQPKAAKLRLQLFPQLDRHAKPLARDNSQYVDGGDDRIEIETDPLPFPPGTTFDVKPPTKK
jgi:hypothetical protein